MDSKVTERKMTGSSGNLLNSTSPIRPTPVFPKSETEEESSSLSGEASELDHDSSNESDESDKSEDFDVPEDIQGDEKPDEGYYRVDQIEDHVKGVPRLAALLNRAESFTIFRFFGWSHARVLMHLQIELNEMEKKLRALDKQDSKRRFLRWHRLRLVELEEGQDTRQRDMIRGLKEKLREYDDLLLKYSQVLNLGRPSERNYKSVAAWIWDNKPLAKEQRDFIELKDDFISLAAGATPKSWFQELIESYVIRKPDSWLEGFLNTELEKQKTRDVNIKLMSPARLTMLGRILAISLTTLLHFIPIVLLSTLQLNRGLMAFIVCCFVLAFEITISTVAENRQYDILVGTAAYVAMLLALLENFNQ